MSNWDKSMAVVLTYQKVWLLPSYTLFSLMALASFKSLTEFSQNLVENVVKFLMLVVSFSLCR